MFSADYRDRMRELLVEQARTDTRITAAAAVGSSAGKADRWSDLDLSFGVANGITVDEVLAGWTETMVAEFNAAVLFDLPYLSSIYRVFLLPGALQVDLSFTPAAEFGALGPRFQLLFGEAVERPWPPAPAPDHGFGLGVHHAVRAHICIQRGRLWQAEHWLHAARDEALSLACQRLGLEGRQGRGFDDLPPEVIDAFGGGLVRSIQVDELRRALTYVTEGLLCEGQSVTDRVDRVRPMLEELLQGGAQ